VRLRRLEFGEEVRRNRTSQKQLCRSSESPVPDTTDLLDFRLVGIIVAVVAHSIHH
jgi:hypothetical protein